MFRPACPLRCPRTFLALVCYLAYPEVVCQAEDVDFNRDIRPVLSDKCFLCHGPDKEDREADLRLDVRESALDAKAIVPGDPEASEIVARITSHDPELVMPPPATGKEVTPEERAAIVQWIREGANYQAHWAFESPQRAEQPAVRQQDRVRNPIDAFVLARLESTGQAPSPVADRETLARRISLDLTGLPPTLQQLDHIIGSGDRLDEALNKHIEECLSSPHFGERWGRWWLDAARYADSAGYEKDMPRDVWFYRDWVINALNEDKPYDAFIIEQIAGDLLPNASQSQRVATGFLRNSMTNEEGGADPEQFRVEGMFDRMDAIGKSILGITTQCAQCHTHKYDPLQQSEYYAMFAALNDFHEACITVFTPEQAKQRDQILQSISALEAELKTANPTWREQVKEWALETASQLPEWKPLKPTEHPFAGQKFKILDDGSIVSESYAPTRTSDSFSLTTDVGTITAVRLDALTHPQLPRGGPGRSTDGTGALSEFKMRVQPVGTDENGKPLAAIDVKFVRAISDVNPDRAELKSQYRDKDPSKDKRVVGPSEYAIDGDENTAWTTDIDPGRNNEPRHLILIPETPVQVNGAAKLTFTMVQKHGGWNSDDRQNFLMGRYRFSISESQTIPETTIRSQLEPVVLRDSKKWTDDNWGALFSEWRRHKADRFADANQQIEALWKQFPETATQLVAQAVSQPRRTYVLTRGDFLKPANEVAPGVPSFLHAMEGSAAPDRLRFARWLASKDSPTTARVIVNRIWQAYFGHGLVATPEDFGFQSSPPTHPQLLDFLARELMDNNWSLKHIHRLIVDSATYRQTSSASSQHYREDPRNERLARGPRVRLEAEMVRDLALLAGNLLDQRVGGPSSYPPAPDFLFQPPTSYGPKVWATDKDATQYRRSIYIHQYRSVPYPPLQMFDAPKGDAACVRRERSNTPLQALVLLNEPQFLDAARGLGRHIVEEVPAGKFGDQTDRRRIVLAHRLCTSRTPEPDEVDLLLKFLQTQRETFSQPNNSDNVQTLLGRLPDGQPWAAGISPGELAAWITVARAILNLDETITKS